MATFWHCIFFSSAVVFLCVLALQQRRGKGREGGGGGVDCVGSVAVAVAILADDDEQPLKRLVYVY